MEIKGKKGSHQALTVHSHDLADSVSADKHRGQRIRRRSVYVPASSRNAASCSFCPIIPTISLSVNEKSGSGFA